MFPTDENLSRRRERKDIYLLRAESDGIKVRKRHYTAKQRPLYHYYLVKMMKNANFEAFRIYFLLILMFKINSRDGCKA